MGLHVGVGKGLRTALFQLGIKQGYFCSVLMHSSYRANGRANGTTVSSDSHTLMHAQIP